MRRASTYLLGTGVLAYLVWRMVGVAGDPSVGSIGLLVVETLAWLGFGAFVLRVTPPRRAVPPDGAVDVPEPVLVLMAGGRPLGAVERSLRSFEVAGDARSAARPQVFVVDDGRRDADERRTLGVVAASADAVVVDVADAGVAAAVEPVASRVDPEVALVFVQGGSLLAPGALDALLAPLSDARVGAVQGSLDWSDESTLTLHGPSHDGLDLLVMRDAPANSQAGVAPLIGDGTAFRLDALRGVEPSDTELDVVLSAAGWLLRFTSTTVVHRPQPTSSAEWRLERTAELAGRRRSAAAALVTTGLKLRTRLRLVAGAGDLASAWARVGFAAFVAAGLVTGSVPVPGSLAATLLVAGGLWALAAVLTRLLVAPVWQFGDRVRLGWRRLDADVMASFLRLDAWSRPGRRGGLRALAGFPISVGALVAIDVAGVLRGADLVHPGIVPGVPDALTRVVLGVATVAALALLFDSLRIFVSRADARADLRANAHLAGELATDDAGTTTVEIVDVSTVGVGIVTSAALHRGKRVDLAFDLPDATTIEVSAVVAHIAHIAGDDGARRIGLRFEALQPIARRALMRYVILNPRGEVESRPEAVPVPRAAVVAIPRPVLRFLSVVAVILTSTSLVVGPAGAQDVSTGTFAGVVSGPSGSVPGVCVSAVTDSWQWYGTQTDDSGSYSLEVPAGTYRVQFRDCRPDATERLVTQWWSPAGLVGQNDAAHVVLAEGETHPGVDAALTPGGWFLGAVQDTNGDPVDGICVNPVTVATNSWDGGTTTPTNGGTPGSFATDAMPTGQYRLHVNDCAGRTDPFPQAWVGADGVHLVALSDDAKVFDLAAAPIDVGTLTLEPGTRIAGTVRDDTGAPVAGVCVAVDSPNWSWVAGATTDADGNYATDPVLPGSWVLSFNDCRPGPTLVNTLWTGTADAVNDIAAATRIPVDGTVHRLDGYDQTMLRGGTVAGTVASDAGPVAGACVNAVTVDGDNWHWLAGTQSGPDGQFTLGPLVGQHVLITVDPCQSDQSLLSGIYAGPGRPLTRDTSQATGVDVGPAATLTGLELHPQLGTTLAGTVRGAGVPLAGACVSIIDPDSGYADARQTGDDGTWTMTVPPGSYLVQATDCVPGRNFAGRFATDATTPDTATPVVATGGQPHAPIDFDLPAGAPARITGRVVTGNGATPAACVVAVGPNQEPVAIVQTNPDGSFALGPINAGSYLVAIAGCDFAQNLPPGVTDPTDPSVTYPLQWSSGTALDPANLWAHPAWVTAPSGVPTDLGDVCLQPCNRPATPSTTATTAPPTTTSPPATGAAPEGADTTGPPGPTGTTTPATTAPPTPAPTTPAPTTPARPVTLPFGVSKEIGFVRHQYLATIRPFPDTAVPAVSTAQEALQAIPPPPPPAHRVTYKSDVDALTVSSSKHAARVTTLPKLRESGSTHGSSGWWWLVAAAVVLGLGAAAVPWYLARRASRY